jgi:uncharacterized membrane protein
MSETPIGPGGTDFEDPPPDPSSTGLDPTLAALLAYLLGFVSGLLFLVIEKRSRFVRFHAMQSTVTFLALFVISFVAGFVPVLGSLVGFLAWVLSLVLWILLMVKAFQGEWFRLPVVGEMAEERAGFPQ